MTDTTKTSAIEQALTAHWGERCPDIEQGCPCCDAWAEYDALRNERDALALVIMGGEDAPGLAASLSVKELQKLQLENQANTRAFHEYDLAEARNAALHEAANVATYFGAQQMPSDGSYSHHEPVMGPDVADAILALIDKETDQ